VEVSLYIWVTMVTILFMDNSSRFAFLDNNNNNNHSSVLSLWNLKIMKDTLRLSFHLRMLPHAVTIALPIWEQQRVTHVHPTL
jgi:hypothetical protein